eukprot:CAMPEP_0114565778 /NCGR_PEP_ID=MMETSP0114-20121206/14504_1 /TAXON_ID=31324 /ORGANISM="Goniomonas sp, Strain m" /LENGTH=39 /DNA_ID= /DNA_START= /DNA_END= /DNA_ORIENTATION=
MTSNKSVSRARVLRPPSKLRVDSFAEIHRCPAFDVALSP